jgi:hypothetical protein
MQAGILTTDCPLTAGVNTRGKPRCGKLYVYSDRLFCEKSGKKESELEISQRAEGIKQAIVYLESQKAEIERNELTGLRQKTIRKQPQTQVAQGIYTKH